MFVNLPTGSGKSLIYQENGADRHTRLLRFVAFVHLPFSFRSLDLFGFVFLKGTSCCVVRRIFKLIKFSYVINMKSPEIKNQMGDCYFDKTFPLQCLLYVLWACDRVMQMYA